MTQTFWLSFTDASRPKGDQFLGVAIVDVTEADRDAAVPFVLAKRPPGSPPPTDDVLWWLGAALTKAHQTGCNPGGAVASSRIDDHPDFAIHGPRYPRHRLLSRAEVEALEPADV